MSRRNPFLVAAMTAALATIATQGAADDTEQGMSSKGKSSAASSANGGSKANGASKANDASKANGGDSKAQGNASEQKSVAAIVLVPIAIATTEDFGDGCWVRLYDDQNFTGNQLSLMGPMDMPHMRTAFGRDWSGEFDSVAVGPKATVTVYDNENYTQRVATFQPDQRIRDLDEKMGFFEDIRSLKVACAGGGATAQQAKGAPATAAPAAGGSQQSGTGKSGSKGY